MTTRGTKWRWWERRRVGAFIFPDHHRASLGPSFFPFPQLSRTATRCDLHLKLIELRGIWDSSQGDIKDDISSREKTSWNEIPFTELNRLSSTFNLLRETVYDEKLRSSLAPSYREWVFLLLHPGNWDQFNLFWLIATSLINLRIEGSYCFHWE